MIIAFSVSCKTSKKFYFNNHVIPETKIYKFVNENDSNDIVYWEMFYTTKDTFVTNTYDSNLFLTNEFVETLDHSGSKLIKYTSYYEFHDQPAKANITKDDVFSWTTTDPIQYEVNYRVEQDQISILKERKYLSDQKIIFNNRFIKTKIFKDSFIVTENSKVLDSTYNISYYAKGLGVIQFNSHIGQEINKMKLDKILTKNEFQALKTYR